MLNPWIEAHELRELVLAKEVRPRDTAENSPLSSRLIANFRESACRNPRAYR
jgi:hypothetical protein